MNVSPSANDVDCFDIDMTSCLSQLPNLINICEKTGAADMKCSVILPRHGLIYTSAYSVTGPGKAAERESLYHF